MSQRPILADDRRRCILSFDDPEKAKSIGAKPLARLTHYAVVGCKAEEMGSDRPMRFQSAEVGRAHYERYRRL